MALLITIDPDCFLLVWIRFQQIKNFPSVQGLCNWNCNNGLIYYAFKRKLAPTNQKTARRALTWLVLLLNIWPQPIMTGLGNSSFWNKAISLFSLFKKSNLLICSFQKSDRAIALSNERPKRWLLNCSFQISNRKSDRSFEKSDRKSNR